MTKVCGARTAVVTSIEIKKKELGEGGVWYMDRKRGWGEGAAGVGVVFKITFIQEKSFNFLT